MESYDQHRPPYYTRERDRRQPNQRHAHQPLLYQNFGSNELGFGDTITDPLGFQPHDTQSFQEAATRPISNVYAADNTISEDSQLHMWQQRGIGELERSVNHSGLAQMTDHDAASGHWNAPGDPNGWEDYGAFPSEQSSASFSKMPNHPADCRASSVTAYGVPNSFTHPAPDLLREDVTYDSQSLQAMDPADHDVVSHNSYIFDTNHLDIGQNMALSNANPEPEPWSAYQTASVYQVPNEEPESDWHYVPATTPSTTDYDESGSGYTCDFASSLSSTNYVSEPMIDSVGTVRPVPLDSGGSDLDQIPSSFPPTIPYIQPFQPLPIRIQRSRTPIETSSNTREFSSRGLGGLAVPMRRLSSRHSSTSETSSCGRPPAYTPKTISCGEEGCNAAFTGQYRRGNLARHRRHKHLQGRVYVCEDDTCAREFQRQDARLKHYRKYHPERAADRPYISRSAASGSTGREQEADLINISSWANDQVLWNEDTALT